MYLETNEIISACRLSIAYWEMATGETEQWKNPGKCVMSWIIATCLDQEMTVLPKELQEKYNQCESFSHNITRLLSSLEVAVDKLVWRMTALGFKVPTLEQQIETLFSNIEEIKDQSASDLFFVKTAMNKHKLITLAAVYQKVEEQLTSQEKRIEKK